MRSAIFLALLLAGCAAALGDPDEREADALARELAGRVAGEPARCVSAPPSNDFRPIDGGAFVMRRGDTIWVNRPDGGECPGFRPFSTLIVETQGGQYCRGDHVRALDPGSTIAGPTCVLGEFVPYRRAS
jgi:hypothetical protein